jgi:Nif-specific regulatory protein
MADFCKKTGGECYGIRELNLLLEISTILNKPTHNLKENLQLVVEKLAQYLHAERVILTILNRTNSQIYIEVGFGLTAAEQDRGTYNIGEGIIGKVVETGTPIVIPRIRDDDTYLNKTGTVSKIPNTEVSFICVPIKNENEIVGTLSIHRIYNRHITFAEDARILSIIGSMVAQSVRNRQQLLEEIEHLQDENRQLQSQLKERIVPKGIVGNSSKMAEVFDLIEKVAPTNATVLIRGESGVGKELIADAIHFGSDRRHKPFIKVNCAALPDSLIESELFGHEKGAFTGANILRKGRFEAAEGGTIFLDEIGDLPASTQVKLLRVLQQREFERLGSTKPIQIDVRIICATNRNLEESIQKNEFREDLFYRINVFPLYIPPLRERINDVPALVDYFISKCNKNHNTKIKRISSSAIDMLMVYHWPGNIRELENCIERACILSTDSVIRSHNLPPTLQTSESSKTKTKGTLDAILGNVEKQMIKEALLASRGNIAKAAESLGITERIMGIRLKTYDIDPKRFKQHKVE